MAITLVLNAQKILDKVFSPSGTGYDAFEVDEFLDTVLSDYRNIEAGGVISKDDADALKERIATLEKEKQELEIEIARLKTNGGQIGESEGVTTENAKLLKRISNFELFLFQHGYDPNLIE